jgi:hypothetical protein
VLAVLVGTILVGSISLFVGMVAVETYKVCERTIAQKRLARTISAVPAASLDSKALDPSMAIGTLESSTWYLNPMSRRNSADAVAGKAAGLVALAADGAAAKHRAQSAGDASGFGESGASSDDSED